MKMNKMKIAASLKDNLYIISTIVVFLLFYILKPSFLSLYSIQNLASEVAPLLMMALGVAFVIYCGCIDLSTGAIASCTCVITGIYVEYFGNWILPLIFIAGVVIGLISGILVTWAKIPAFIVTLCAQSIWKCVALVVSNGGTQNLSRESRHIVAWVSNKVAYLPVIFWISIAALLLCVFIEKRTVIGKDIFSTGANSRAARIAGVNIRRAIISAYVFSGVGSAMSGAMYAYKLKSSVPNVGDNLNLMAIAAVALGGTMMSGGKGSAWRTFIGVCTVIAISSGMNMVGVEALWKDIVFGIIVIATIILNTEKDTRNLVVK